MIISSRFLGAGGFRAPAPVASSEGLVCRVGVRERVERVLRVGGIDYWLREMVVVGEKEVEAIVAHNLQTI